MLEKIGLPAKPSMRGASWVVDASHCQGCSSQFTFLNRKHHCQRCGGLFCSSCTQQRMVLRGQGDSSVRICDPCKKIEEAARFELRYGHRNRGTKANPKADSRQEDDILSEILGADGKQPLDAVPSDFGRSESTASSSSSRKGSIARSMEGDRHKNISMQEQVDRLSNVGSIFTPEELRQQAADEKKKYKTLKAEGKPEEALQAFKHGKELERQAAALEIELRKSRRMASKAPHVSSVVNTQKIEDCVEPGTQKNSIGKSVKKEKNDLASELKELGWSDADLHDNTKPVSLSVEGELSQLLREVAPKSSEGRKAGGIDKSQVNAHKRQALSLKREGRLAEAKEELKKAKILEKQLEEQEILGEAEESDDELAAIIHNMDDDNHDDLLLDNPRTLGFNFEQIMHASDDLAIDGNFDVTDDDMNDPDMAAALKSFGWSEDDDRQPDSDGLLSPSQSQETLQEQVLSLKREAVAQKRAGNVAEAMSLLKRVKLLEKDLEITKSDANTLSPEVRQKHMLAEEGTLAEMNIRPVAPPKSKLAIQRELLALKKRALALRREGKLDEAEEELKKGNVLEKQLEELENAAQRTVAKESKNFESASTYSGKPPNLDLRDEGPEPEVTDNDMQDPVLLSVLKNMGWEDDDTGSVERTATNTSAVVPPNPMKSKGQIQKELLALKRKALALRRQGKIAESEEELEKAKILEQQIAEIEVPDNSNPSEVDARGLEHAAEAGSNMISITTHSSTNMQLETDISGRQHHGAKESSDLMDLSGIAAKGAQSSPEAPAHKEPQPPGQVEETTMARSKNTVSSEETLAHGDDTLKDEILQHKRKAVALKREGKLAEARGELRQAKLLEKQLEDGQQTGVRNGDATASTSNIQESKLNQPASVSSTDASASAPTVQENKSNQAQKALSSRDRLKIQRESLAHKRNALKLRREGKSAEADAEFELAKSLENQLEESDSQGSKSSGKSEEANDAVVEDLLDPQIMSALKSIGWNDTDFLTQPSKKAEAKPTIDVASNSRNERTHLEEQIKAEKLKALNFKREGKQAEALEALRSSKRLEKKLGLLS